VQVLNLLLLHWYKVQILTQTALQHLHAKDAAANETLIRRYKGAIKALLKRY
jgi:hypothetical protein